MSAVALAAKVTVTTPKADNAISSTNWSWLPVGTIPTILPPINSTSAVLTPVAAAAKTVIATSFNSAGTARVVSCI